MKKRPIYLYVLLGLSVVGTLLAIYGKFIAPTSLPTEQISSLPEPLRTEFPAYFEKSIALNNSLLTNFFFYSSIILLIVTFVFVIRKDILKANISYIAMVLLGLVSRAYGYVATRDLLYSSFSDSQFADGQMLTVTIGTVVGVGISLIFLSIVVFKLIQQQKEADKEEIKQEEPVSEQ